MKCELINMTRACDKESPIVFEPMTSRTPGTLLGFWNGPKLVNAFVYLYSRTAVEGLWIAFRRMTQEQAEYHERPRRLVQTLVWFATSLVVAVKVPTIGAAIALVGGVAALFIFFYPGNSSIPM